MPEREPGLVRHTCSAASEPRRLPAPSLQRALGPDKAQTKTKKEGAPQELTRAMKKMLALKAAAAGRSGGARTQQQQQQRQQQRPQQQARAQQQAEQQQPAEGDAQPARGQEAPPAAAQQQQQHDDAPRGQPAGGGGKGQQGQQEQAPLEGSLLFQQKRLKDKKRAFLARKAARKAGRGGDPLLSGTEAALAARTAASKPAFGEQVRGGRSAGRGGRRARGVRGRAGRAPGGSWLEEPGGGERQPAEPLRPVPAPHPL